VKAYVRAKWEVTQWLLDKAEVSTVDLYRSIALGTEGERVEKVLGNTFKGYSERLPDTVVRRNGAASWSIDRNVVNNWPGEVKLRAQVPRTAVISVPAYGQNAYSEREVVVAGTGWKSWDGWKSEAPSLRDVPIGHQTTATP
jgi:hypothetical protein